ncbi:hypothetical protein M438DRAFT_271068, partial [Aureobasidium pullulans EXF-150]
GIHSTYGHSQLKTGHPVRSAIHKQLNGRLVLRWVTTWESLLLYVLFCISSFDHQPFCLVPRELQSNLGRSVILENHVGCIGLSTAPHSISGDTQQ